jgi:hypothetical protein
MFLQKAQIFFSTTFYGFTKLRAVEKRIIFNYVSSTPTTTPYEPFRFWNIPRYFPFGLALLL